MFSLVVLWRGRCGFHEISLLVPSFDVLFCGGVLFYCPHCILVFLLFGFGMWFEESCLELLGLKSPFLWRGCWVQAVLSFDVDL
jgi:hypothetical protein